MQYSTTLLNMIEINNSFMKYTYQINLLDSKYYNIFRVIYLTVTLNSYIKSKK